uniref:DNA-directed DNA polymerase n=2 Tax=unclassified Herpesvirales TaxID=860343 RepID=A0AB33V8Z8_9VIRU
MDPGCDLAKLTHLFPAQRSLRPEESETLTPLFFSSVRHVSRNGEDVLLIHVLNLRSKETGCIMVKSLAFLAVVPQVALSSVAFNALVAESAPHFHHDYTVFNGDLKKHMPGRLFVFHSMEARRLFIKRGNAILNRIGENVYTYGDHRSTYEGNTVALYNNLMCSHVYHVRLKGGSEIYEPWDFVYDAAVDSRWAMNLGEITKYCKREGAFDIETLVHEVSLDPDMVCRAFEKSYFKDADDARELLAGLRSKGVAGIPTSPFVGLTQKLHEITSISLVVCNYHKPKDGPRKELIVYYNEKLLQHPLEEIPVAHLGLDWDRIVFKACKNEFYMLMHFINKLKSSVDVLYVFNAQFDIKVICQRLAYYAFEGRRPGCCKCHAEISREYGDALMEKWELFLSRKPQLVKGEILMGSEILQAQYIKMLRGVSSLLAAPGGGNVGLIKKKLEMYKQGKDTVQNFKTVGFGCDIIDMMYVCKRKEYETPSGSGALNDVAKLIIQMYRPKKLAAKTVKLGDVEYRKMDEYYRYGGTKLAECLVYNLIDSQLVVRMAKFLKPVEEYIFRQLACYNLDVAAHTRGVMNFSGFIQSTKVVEVSRNKARLDAGIVLATGNLSDSLFTPETIPRRGGFVANPLTGLFFAQPTQCLEMCLDFTSLYPSIMCDLNISPETIVDLDKAEKIEDFVGYDWSQIQGGFKKMTLVLSVDRSDPENPKLVRHFSDTSGSLSRYLALRAHHKREMKANKEDPLAHGYHDRLQNEMKICANTHYGVSDHTCSLMITTQGQHKIKHVNAFISRLNRDGVSLFPNYGDTDSTMFFPPHDRTERPVPDTARVFWDKVMNKATAVVETGDSRAVEAGEDCFSPELKDHIVRKMRRDIVDHIKTKFKSTDIFVNTFLEEAAVVLFDDMVSKLVLHTRKGTATPVKDEGRNTWTITDPVTGKEMDCTTPFRKGLICKLEYENASSIGCHVAKKMYLCLVHELNNGTLISTKIKKRGMTGFKCSRFGATETITNDFVDLIFKGGVLRKKNSLEALTSITWDKLEVGMEILHFSETPKFESGKCTNLSNLSLVPHRVTALEREPVPELQGGECIYVDLLGCESGKRFVQCVLLVNGCAMNHIVSFANVLLREMAFETLSYFRAFYVSAGFIKWSDLVIYEKVPKLKKEFLSKLEEYGLFPGKKLKLPFVTLQKKKGTMYDILKAKRELVDFPVECQRQDPAYSFFRHYPVDLRLENMARDYFGDGLKCMSTTFAPPPYKVKGAHATHHIHIKNHIDRGYLNDNSKFLAHVVVDKEMFSSCHLESADPEGAVADTISRVSRAVMDAKVKLMNISKRGSQIFYDYFNSTPPEMNRTRSSFAYSLERDGALTPRAELPPLMRCRPEDMYAEAINNMAALVPNLGGLLKFEELPEKGGSPFSAFTLCALPPRVARDLGVSPVVSLECDDTGSAPVVRFAQNLYVATLARHYLDLDQFETYPPRTCAAEGAITEPPARITPGDLKTWIRDLSTLFAREGTPKAHCVGCQSFWESCAGTPNLIAKLYSFDGHVLVKKTPPTCMR